MYEILKTKGYNGNNNIQDVVKWLLDKGIQVDFVTTWKKEKDDEISGKMVQFHFPPYSKIRNSEVMCSYEDAFEQLIYSCIDYL